MPPNRALPIELQMVQPVCGLDQRRAVAGGGERDAHTVRRRAEPDVLLFLYRLLAVACTWIERRNLLRLLLALERRARFLKQGGGRGLGDGAQFALQHLAALAVVPDHGVVVS